MKMETTITWMAIILGMTLNAQSNVVSTGVSHFMGDLNYWWVMNDKGNIHTETGADPIGMEIRGQAFCFGFQ